MTSIGCDGSTAEDEKKRSLLWRGRLRLVRRRLLLVVKGWSLLGCWAGPGYGVTWAVELEASVVGCVAAEALASLEQLHTLHAHPPAPKHIPRHIGHGDLRAGS